jgi:hypothetical protein
MIMTTRTRRQFLANVGQGMLIASVGPTMAANLGVSPAFAGEDCIHGEDWANGRDGFDQFRGYVCHAIMFLMRMRQRVVDVPVEDSPKR